MKCRICDCPNTRMVEEVQFYSDLVLPVYDCERCGCRFSESQPALYDTFHSNAAHYYTSRMRAWTETAKALFDRRDAGGLRREVRNFHFAMPRVEETFKKNGVRSILEAGCAWGYNSSYFILEGYDLLGVDISRSAIEQARRAFGDHFCTIDDPRYGEHAKFDGIFHLGTVGCVERPIEFTQQLLDRLKPGGVLIFNAPTRRPTEQLDSPWIWGACPPDLVTLFPDSFWEEWFGGTAKVETILLDRDATSSLRLRLARRKGRRQPDRGRLLQPKAGQLATLGRTASRWKAEAKTIIGAIVGLFVQPLANDFGVIVSIKKI